MEKVSNNGRKIVTILNVPIDGTPERILLSQLREKMKSKKRSKPLFIATPNAEHLVLASKDSEFKSIIQKADIAIPDAIGIVAAEDFLSRPNPNGLMRFPVLLIQGIAVGWQLIARAGVKPSFTAIKGREFFLGLLTVANEEKLKVFLLGGTPKASSKALQILQSKYPDAFFQAVSGAKLMDDASPKNSVEAKIEKATLSAITKFKPDIVFVAFGAPKQEKWIEKHKDKLPVKAFMVVGGTFDYISGETKLPPRLLSGSFEWLWRLIHEPYRYKRIFTAVVIFPWLVFKEKLQRD